MSRGQFRVLGLVLVALLVSLFLAGCETAAVEKTPRQPKLKVTAKTKRIAVPKDWPKEIPTYPNAELIEVTTTVQGKILYFKTKDTADKVFEWYYDTLEAAKWNMKGPTLDVAQNLAIIKSELGQLSFLLDTRRAKGPEADGSIITLTTPAPKLGGP